MLSDKQQAFVREYLLEPNATQAAIKAGYSARSAHVTGARLLANANVRAAIDAVLIPRRERLDISADRVVLEIARVAFSSMRNYASWSADSMDVEPSEFLSDDHAAAISEITFTTTKDGSTTKIKLHNKLPALEKLFAYLGLDKEKPPLEILLASLPAELAAQLRQLLARQLGE